MRPVSSTDPPSLSVHVDAPDVLGQVGAGAEALRAAVPAAGVGHGLGGGRAGAALAVHHDRGGAAAGHRALHLHQGAADTEGQGGGLDTSQTPGGGRDNRCREQQPPGAKARRSGGDSPRVPLPTLRPNRLHRCIQLLLDQLWTRPSLNRPHSGHLQSQPRVLSVRGREREITSQETFPACSKSLFDLNTVQLVHSLR